MKRDKHAIPLLLTCLLAVLAAPLAATAQQDEPASAAELVTDYLEQDIFLRPGVGLKKVKIGMAFDDVRRVWGPPTATAPEDFIGNKWTYEIADHTRITLLGDARVKIMRVSGEFNSPYVTSEGASFGMARHQLATIYGARATETDEVNYNERGIGFELEHGQVSEIRVFSPE